jgi:hypothetical protein
MQRDTPNSVCSKDTPLQNTASRAAIVYKVHGTTHPLQEQTTPTDAHRIIVGTKYGLQRLPTTGHNGTLSMAADQTACWLHTLTSSSLAQCQNRGPEHQALHTCMIEHSVHLAKRSHCLRHPSHNTHSSGCWPATAYAPRCSSVATPLAISLYVWTSAAASISTMRAAGLQRPPATSDTTADTCRAGRGGSSSSSGSSSSR